MAEIEMGQLGEEEEDEQRELNNTEIYAVLLRGIVEKEDLSAQEKGALIQLQSRLELSEPEVDKALSQAGLLSKAHFEDMMEENEHYKW
eukprot:CAMPEP_0201484478 /NCGR_PEP_ID=MMETSP0151_2-20130828/8662_1 /ASSEMBLY_ACC=CAM_ASM_000257 /TAXON_ID=200890 /ORGANISM="Paramoeba atlantica, Strain 621/1 / CCAP 1560/9" /LENGTH=88 /DNA_ID=CAMNT_0047868169 /DNA_START=31 /DNA_END=294 /DNA_ORIENTATION=+